MSDTKEIKTVKRIPYGITDYELIRTENYYYVDKTHYLKKIKDAGRYLFFIRPRRFGKSLFLSMMEVYYDVLYKERFEELFKGTAIFEEPTSDRGNYLILKFNFSLVDPDVDNVEASFLHHVRSKVTLFMDKYSDYLDKEGGYFKKTIAESRSASDILSSINDLSKKSHQKLIVIIDEYDNFANTILSTSGETAYEKLTHGAGSFRSFFSVLKGGTDGTDAPFSRLFLTGVSPITLDDVTSGYNIGKNISLESPFNRMLGFTRDDAREMIEYYYEKETFQHETEELVEIMTEWYGNYLFSEDDDVKLFNPDMVLYFMDNYLTRKTLPDDLIDRNVRIDYGKLRHLIIVDSNKTARPSLNGNFGKLKEIMEKGEISAKIARGFPLEELKDRDNFVSLLFYFGLLTIESVDNDKKKLRIPNETVKRLYYDYIKKGYRESDGPVVVCRFNERYGLRREMAALIRVYYRADAGEYESEGFDNR